MMRATAILLVAIAAASANRFVVAQSTPAPTGAQGTTPGAKSKAPGPEAARKKARVPKKTKRAKVFN
ncbi:MAG TPA: hypothetical protein VFV04_05145 [Burkholderiales bacterium]|nr:hypothetical protein [Burkholderiales bacterium]